MSSGAPTGPDWAQWRRGSPLTLGVEEEVMLLEAGTWSLHQDADGVLASLDGDLRPSACAETHASALELATDVHADVSGAVGELAGLRAQLHAHLAARGLAAGAAGLHAFTTWQDTRISRGQRYRALSASLHGLAEREPTFALHVHVAVPEPESAVRVMNGLRDQLPLLLALSGNSPFWQGRDSGMASMRIPLFQAFPRTGQPRAFASYGDWVECVETLVRPGAIPDSTHIWWDVRLQPRFGTVEVRIMDAQTEIADTAALVALIQCLAGGIDSGEPVAPGGDASAEVLGENCFIAARDGMRARLIVDGHTVEARAVVEEVARRCEARARDLGCAAELADLARLAESTGADRQRRSLAEDGEMAAVVAGTARAFVRPLAGCAPSPHPLGRSVVPWTPRPGQASPAR